MIDRKKGEKEEIEKQNPDEKNSLRRNSRRDSRISYRVRYAA